MGRLLPLLFLVEVGLVAVAVISCLSAEDDEIRTLPRFGWILIILFFPLVGPVAWFTAGRPLAPAEAIGPGRLGGGGGFFSGAAADRQRPQRRWPAPEDDPEFLRSLDTERAKRDRELFSRWEDELLRPGDERPGDERPGDERPEDERPEDERPEDERPEDEQRRRETGQDDMPS